jgi:hypothetical protein
LQVNLPLRGGEAGDFHFAIFNKIKPHQRGAGTENDRKGKIKRQEEL